MKKYNKLLILMFMSFFITNVSVLAKEVTLNDLGKEIEKYQENANEALIIGNYVFTDAYKIGIQDVMLAANKSESVISSSSETEYRNMAIYRLRVKYKDHKRDGWELVDNFLGDSTLQLDDEHKIDVRYIDYHFLPRTSTATINADVDDSKYSKYKDVLESKLHFTTEKYYGENNSNEKKLLLNNGKLSGLLLKNNDVTLNDKDKAKNGNYFFALIIEVPDAGDKTTIKVNNLNGESNINWDSFDVQKDDEGKTPGVVILVPVNREKWQKEENQKMTITVDIDGDGNEYEATPYEIDLSSLSFQEDSLAILGLNNASETDKKQLIELGYSSSYNELTLEEGNNVKLTGTMKEQVVKPEAFGKDNINGYYFDFTFEIPEEIDKDKVKIARLNGSDLSSGTKKEFEKSEWTDDGKLTILFRFPEDPKCETDESNCKLYYTVDFDGEVNKYLPTLYTIDYSEVTFKKSSLVTLDPVASTTITGEDWKGFEEGNDYKVEFDKESSTFKVTGLITIYDDEWNGSENPFKDAYDYYLAFKLSKEEVDGEGTDTIVKFLTDGDGHGDENAISKEDFGKNKSIYVLKYLNPNKEYDNKKFTITIDFDDNGEEYEPYTITIDWSELDFQYETKVADTIIVDPSATSSDTNRGYISEQNKKDVEEYGYDFDNVGNIKIENEGLEGYKLTGIVKEQDVKNGGFKETTGYYVPVKIYGPTIADANENHYLSQADGRRKWTIYLKNEEGNYKDEITPSEEDYKNGYIVVLFKLKDDRDKKITYKIDWDGSKSNVFLEQEVIISYDELQHQALNTITYKYKDAEGKEQTESTEVYQNEEATLKDITGINSDYRKFDGWYKSDKTKVDGETLTISDDKDETLTAHWKLDADAFIKAVMENLNAKEGTAEKFNLTMDESNNTITIDVEDSRVLLSEMNDTNIPGAIAYILQKGEITGVTLSTENKKVEFTKDGANNQIVPIISLDEDGSALKDTIKKGAQALFKDVLSDESTYTLSKMALNDKDFTLEISSTDENSNLVDSENKTYTFKFETEAITVINEDELTKALANEKISHIYLGTNFDVQEQHDINRSVTINGGKKDAEGSYKITLKDENKNTVDSIFKVSAQGVTIDNIELSKTKEAIDIDGAGANLTITGLKLTNIEKAGINVINGSLNAKDVTFESETHDIPTVLVEDANKKNAKVNIEKATKNDPKCINVKLHRDKKWCADKGPNYGKDDDATMSSCKTKSWDDEYTSTKDTYYYLNNENIKNYVFVPFMGAKDSMWTYRLYESGQQVGTFDEFYGKEKITEKSKDYYFVGYGKTRRRINDFTNGDVYYSDLILDIAEETAGTREWYFANFAEREESKYVTLDESVKDVEGYNVETKYYTYKFKDNEKQGGMTIGQLKAIDENFSKIWEKLEAKAQENDKEIKDEKGQEVNDSTVINEAIKLKLENSL